MAHIVNHFTAVYDSNVLYSGTLRNFFMWLAVEDLYRARWTNEIHEEWIRNVLADRADLTREKLERTRRLMNTNVRDCLVTDYESLIDAVTLPDPKDRHVLAAAIKANANSIVTFNLKHFPKSETSKYGVEAIDPDDFVMCQLDLERQSVLHAAREHRKSLVKHPKNVDQYLESLERAQMVQTAAEFRRWREFI